MLVDDGFSVLDTDCGIIGERKAVNEVKVVKVPIGQIFPNPYQPRKSFDEYEQTLIRDTIRARISRKMSGEQLFC